MQSNQSNQRLFSVREAAGRLGVSERYIYSLIARGELYSVKLGRRRLIDARDAERFIDERRELKQ